MSRDFTKGWLPVDIHFDPDPALITDARVVWLQMGSQPLDDPFFGQTVQKLRDAMPPASEIELSVNATLRLARLLPEVKPEGFIFHVSHCGSTLLANALKPGAVVASEVTSLGKVARLYPEPAGHYLARRWEETQRQLLGAIFQFLAHYKTGEAQKLAIKFSSFSTHAIAQLRKHWPGVPCVVLVRDPVEVLASALAERGWLALKEDPEGARVIFGLDVSAEEVVKMPNEEFCARVLGSQMRAVLDAVDDGCWVIDYEDLQPAKIAEVAGFFGLELPQEPGEMERFFSVYAKDPGKALRFEPDSFRKQRQASDECRQASQKWCWAEYVELRSRGRL